MPMAARVSDMTSHGTPLAPGPGSTNVLIGGLCKARHDRGYSAFNVRSINFVCVKNTQVVTPEPCSRVS